MTTLEKLKQISESAPSNWREKAQWRKDNRDWLRKSGRIAIAVLAAIDSDPDMSQTVLAEKMGVTKQYISKLVKGQENLSLQTICKLESALGITLVEVQVSQASQMATPVEYCQHQWHTSKQVFVEMASAFSYSESYQVA